MSAEKADRWCVGLTYAHWNYRFSPRTEVVAIDDYFAELDRHRSSLIAKMNALARLDGALSAGVADGMLAVVTVPDVPRTTVNGIGGLDNEQG